MKISAMPITILKKSHPTFWITTIIIILTSLIINVEKSYAGILPSISIGSSGDDSGGERELPKKELGDGKPKKIGDKLINNLGFFIVCLHLVCYNIKCIIRWCL